MFLAIYYVIASTFIFIHYEFKAGSFLYLIPIVIFFLSYGAILYLKRLKWLAIIFTGLIFFGYFLYSNQKKAERELRVREAEKQVEEVKKQYEEALKKEKKRKLDHGDWIVLTHI